MSNRLFYAASLSGGRTPVTGAIPQSKVRNWRGKLRRQANTMTTGAPQTHEAIAGLRVGACLLPYQQLPIASLGQSPRNAGFALLTKAS